MDNLQINLGDVVPVEAAFWNTFGGSDRIYFNGDYLLDISMEDFNSYLKVFTGRELHGEYTYTLRDGTYTIGGVQIEHLSYVDGLVQVSISVLAVADAASFLEDFLVRNTYKKPTVEGEYNIYINHYYRTPHGLDSIHHEKDTTSFKSVLDELYPSIHVKGMMKLYSDSEESILILTGAPGTGKTCFAKKCIAEHGLNLRKNISVAYVKDPSILIDDGFWANLSNSKPDLLILDDLDDELLPRTEGRNPIVNNLLSFSDGIFDNNTKIIITTNQPNSRIDTALVRPGRCFDILALPQLTIPEAEDIWVNTLKGDLDSFSNSFGGLTVVSQALLMSEYTRWCKLNAPKYLKDPTISIRSRIEDGIPIT